MTCPEPTPSLHALQRRSDNTRLAALEADTLPTLTKLRLDMKRTSYVGTKGNLTCFITDIELGARKAEPALLIANRTSPTDRHVYVRLGELWQLIDPADPEAVSKQQKAIVALTERLYGFVTRDDSFRVLDAIYDFAQDLIHAKPPTWITNAQWLQALAEDDMTISSGGIVLNG